MIRYLHDVDEWIYWYDRCILLLDLEQQIQIYTVYWSPLAHLCAVGLGGPESDIRTDSESNASNVSSN